LEEDEGETANRKGEQVAREQIGNFEAAQETFEKLRSPGALLVAGKDAPNIMTIGWGTLGVVWGRPMLIVLVRPSRHTHSFLEEHNEFTVCLPAPDMEEAVSLCGTRSGRDVDKVAECGFTMERGKRVSAPYIAQCPLHYECRVVHRNEVLPKNLDGKVRAEYYSAGDYHTVYFGEILGVYRES
jgi:flavin reductase (DIM6/NTAB) family NADH-FMN oxidoreductase RutF